MANYYYSFENRFFFKKGDTPSEWYRGETTRSFRKAIDIMNSYVRDSLRIVRYEELRIMRYEDGKPQSEGVEVARVNYSHIKDSLYFYLK